MIKKAVNKRGNEVTEGGREGNKETLSVFHAVVLSCEGENQVTSASELTCFSWMKRFVFG